MDPSSPPIADVADRMHSPSLTERLKSSLKLPSCFTVSNSERFVYGTPRLVRPASSRSTSRGFGSHSHGHAPLADHPFKDKAKHFLSSHLGGSSTRHRRRHSSADFHYDEASYSLNFDDGGLHEGDGGLTYIPPFRNFSSRLPASPPPGVPPRAAQPPAEVQPGVRCS
ncbi:hypothetical protein SAY87_018879 [Trapa incisa]|uniref:Uncharacterized protein n=1 Tax=Trapa incisa TaxID=236973 RepID=A0AAN7Q1G2_9MYRT|nr:hypothetical protein SAY87_018879 [Trapa incisa]